jgi:hypothetical protein
LIEVAQQRVGVSVARVPRIIGVVLKIKATREDATAGAVRLQVLVALQVDTNFEDVASPYFGQAVGETDRSDDVVHREAAVESDTGRVGNSSKAGGWDDTQWIILGIELAEVIPDLAFLELREIRRRDALILGPEGGPQRQFIDHSRAGGPHQVGHHVGL